MLEQESLYNQFCNDPNFGLPFQMVKKDTTDFFDSGIFKLWEMFLFDKVKRKSKIEILESCNYPIEHINGKPHGSLPWELSKYVYKREQKADEEQLREHVRKVNDHLIDDLRYIVMAGKMSLSTGGGLKSDLDGSW